VCCEFWLNGAVDVFLFVDRYYILYSVVCFDDLDVELIVCEHVGVLVVVFLWWIWCFVCCVGVDVVLDYGYVYLQMGFVFGKIYDCYYCVEYLLFVGFGFIVVRDSGVFLCFGDVVLGNFCGGLFDRVYVFGVS